MNPSRELNVEQPKPKTLIDPWNGSKSVIGKSTSEYWLKIDSQSSIVYFVNSSKSQLSSVASSIGGFSTSSDGAWASVSSDDQFLYENVQPNEAVKIDEFDEVFDSDFFIQYQIKVEQGGNKQLLLGSLKNNRVSKLKEVAFDKFN